jgi:hypothetical protein
MWAIVDDGQSFFGWNPVASDVAPGAQFYISLSFLEGITDAVCNDGQRFRVSGCPRRHQNQRTVGTAHPPPPPGLPPTWGPASAPVPSTPARAQSKKEYTYHPKLCVLMDPYLLQYNNVLNLLDILTLFRMRMTDLPTLPQYCLPTGTPFICWNSVLAKCYWAPRCRFPQGHVQKGEATDTFDGAVSDVIKKGVAYYTNLPAGSGSPSGNQNAGGGSQNP